ncbi:MAG: response regulator transcription factor [Alphaproteobacteria bacterium]|nr:response regulator transcription factor [Alphaproteobacteria bacterium]
MRLLLIEDNERLRDLTRKQLQDAGFAVDAVGDLDSAEAAVETTRFDVIVLDLGLPDGDGGSFLKSMRKRGNATPVLVLTARDGLDDRVAHLDAGADDYLVKPFAAPELAARLRALLRRPGQALADRLSVGDITLVVAERSAQVTGQPLNLPRREIALLELFMRRPGRTVTKAEIERAIYAFDDEVTANTIEVLIHRLRKRLSDAGSRVSLETLRGIGYLLRDAGT